jgi:hypothetical protein
VGERGSFTNTAARPAARKKGKVQMNKLIDRDGFVFIPNGQLVRVVMAESVLRFVQHVATKNGTVAEELIIASLVDEDIDSDAPVFLFCRADDEGNTALLATQDIEPYRERLSAVRDGRELDDPLVALKLTLGGEKGN